jgi:protease-4
VQKRLTIKQLAVFFVSCISVFVRFRFGCNYKNLNFSILIESLISEKWAMHEQIHNTQAALILRRLSQGLSMPDYSAERERFAPHFVDAEAWHKDLNGSYKDWDIAASKSGNVAIIPIIGTMTRYGGLCSYGTEQIASWVMEANEASYVSAIVLEINSGGGQVDGTELLGAVVRQSKKPVVAYVTGMAASAAYWVASQAKEIIMESDVTSEVGSIGVLAMHVDASAFYEKEGYKIKILRSEGSQDKALFNGVESLTPEVEASVKSELTVIRERFVSTVQSGRPQISEDVFSGKMYTGKEAIKKGMADRIGFLGDAVYRADLLARKSA